ncbi:putative Bro-N domain-containing protein [Acanthamoeba castellanii mimivirus]|uniref:Bro-N domain-containing protein n=3 Tax=Mimivirus TaxID=315393 RepID=A0A140E078_MIMIV|nr:uncharacterized Bro-N domain-containing protein [Acanthamoeba polyphaga mimivirus]AEQ60167.1 hypothetical protein [Acanthamoeba castellanii mamavirus]AHA45891.1 putative Bro-N domain-containing protein [Hirudovirus strain Sangsue]AMK61703.1 hypothetical protein [Samba virus]BAV61079.1 putative Bro-N domain-containing protein [Acanthamoeba castellanii mimivirus]ADO17975.1 uncharacterized Bro-N domain-containing protein [Acanthamoeba polyphaga mimivirus]
MVNNVESKNKLSFCEFSKNFGHLNILIPKSLDKKTKFINLSGFCNLIHHSKKPFAMKIKKWLAVARYMALEERIILLEMMNKVIH